MNNGTSISARLKSSGDIHRLELSSLLPSDIPKGQTLDRDGSLHFNCEV